MTTHTHTHTHTSEVHEWLSLFIALLSVFCEAEQPRVLPPALYILYNLETVPGKHSIDSVQKTATLGTAHTIRKVLQCEA